MKNVPVKERKINADSGQLHQRVYWMCTVYRLSVTPENIVVHNKHDRGHSLQHCASATLICAT
jgi:hypothetical protein